MFTKLPAAGHGPLAFVTMAVGWDPVRRSRWLGRRKPDIDLNAAAVVFTGSDATDVIYHGKLLSTTGAVRHLGDSLTGEGNGDNEIITADLSRLPAGATAVMFIVTSYSGQSFGSIRNAFCRVVDGVTGNELLRYTAGKDSAAAGHTGLVVAKLALAEGKWALEAFGDPIAAGHPSDALELLAAYVA